jgi:hypothetical protein
MSCSENELCKGQVTGPVATCLFEGVIAQFQFSKKTQKAVGIGVGAFYGSSVPVAIAAAIPLMSVPGFVQWQEV